MANEMLIKQYLAGAAIAANRIVKFDTTDGTVIQAAAAADLSIGVCGFVAPASGERVDIVQGMQIEVLALVTIYEPRGDYQLNVETIRQAGLGSLYEAFERLKSKLENAGLFRPENKKSLPKFPKQIGIITSPNTAALRDVLVTLRRRNPSLPIVIYPTLVQGQTAANNIVRAIETACQRHNAMY